MPKCRGTGRKRLPAGVGHISRARAKFTEFTKSRRKAEAGPSFIQLLTNFAGDLLHSSSSKKPICAAHNVGPEKHRQKPKKRRLYNPHLGISAGVNIGVIKPDNTSFSPRLERRTTVE